MLLHCISSKYLLDLSSFFMSISHFSITRYASCPLSFGGNIVISLFRQGWFTLLKMVNSLSKRVPRCSLARIYSKRLTAKLCSLGKYTHSITLPYAPTPIVFSRFQSWSGIKKSSSSFLKLRPKDDFFFSS